MPFRCALSETQLLIYAELNYLRFYSFLSLSKEVLQPAFVVVLLPGGELLGQFDLLVPDRAERPNMDYPIHVGLNLLVQNSEGERTIPVVR